MRLERNVATDASRRASSGKCDLTQRRPEPEAPAEKIVGFRHPLSRVDTVLGAAHERRSEPTSLRKGCLLAGVDPHPPYLPEDEAGGSRAAIGSFQSAPAGRRAPGALEAAATGEEKRGGGGGEKEREKEKRQED